MDIRQVTPREAYELLEQNPTAIYLDVRTEAEFEAGHPAGARKVPVRRTVAARLRAARTGRLHRCGERAWRLRRSARPDGTHRPGLGCGRPARRAGAAARTELRGSEVQVSTPSRRGAHCSTVTPRQNAT